MRTVKIALIIILILVGLIFIVGKNIAENSIKTNLQKNMGPGFSIEKIRLKLSSISGSNATLVDPQSNEKLLHIGEMRLYPVLSSLFKKTVMITKIEINKPEIYIYKTPKGKVVGPWMPEGGMKKEEKAPPKKTIAINGIQINNGTLNFSDNAIQNPPSQVSFSNISSHINNLQIPSVSDKSTIDLKGVISGGGEISLGGWVDMKLRNTDVSINIKDADIKTFDPYITSTTPVIVNSGKAYLTSKIVVQDNKLSMPGTLEILNLQTRADPNRKSEILNTKMDSLLNQDRDKITVEFRVNGDLNNPDFDFTKALTLALNQSIGDTLGGKVKEGAVQKGKKSLKKNLPRNK